MTSDQRVMVKNWKWAGAFLLVLVSTFLLPSEHQLSAGLASGFVLVLMLALNPDLRNWKGYGAKRSPTGSIPARAWYFTVVGGWFCLLVLPFLIYRIYSSGGDAWGLYALCFGLLIGPVVIVSEVERYRAAG